MAPPNYAIFETAIGCCGIAWSARGVLSLQLPEESRSATMARLRSHFPEAVENAPTAQVRDTILRLQSLLAGEKSDLSNVALDYDGIPVFSRKVYELARRIPLGHTLSYGQIAAQLGSPRAARAVGRALGRNPWALIVPCHRVLASNGKLTGFSAHGGIATKKQLLAIESPHATATG